MSDTMEYILGCALLFGSLNLAFRVPLRAAGVVAKVIKYSILVNFVILVLDFKSLSGGTRVAMLICGGVWGTIAYCLVAGRAVDYERSIGKVKPAIPVATGPSRQTIEPSVVLQSQTKRRENGGSSGRVTALLVVAGIIWFCVRMQETFHFTLEGFLGGTAIMVVGGKIVTGDWPWEL